VLVIWQLYMWNIVILLPIFFCFLIRILSETNRRPIDLVEENFRAEFALIFIAEYGMILFFCYMIILIFSNLVYSRLFIITSCS